MENRIKYYIAAWAFLINANCNAYNTGWFFWFNVAGSVIMILGSIKYKK